MTIPQLQTKLLVVFAGSLLVAVYLWDRDGSGFHVPPNPLNYVEEGDDRVMHRSKRNALGNRLQAIYQQFSKADSCCPIPQFIPNDAHSACRQFMKLTMQKAKKNAYWFNQVKPVLLSSTSKKTSKKSGRQTGDSQKVTLDFVCYLDCMFTYLHLINNAAMNLSMIEYMFVETNTMDATWEPKIRQAVYTCEQPSACISPETVRVNKKFCSLKPTIMFNCVTQQLYANCKQKNTYTCNTAMAQVRKMNVFNN
ncbi:uncharacterized protein LOC135939700 [Cloeon dipterum]|uniref:uncharacterized protein LOC135939700 n=1 Tax=Cloeon dipterum TaxID=197152 RepID=UPI00321FB14A